MFACFLTEYAHGDSDSTFITQSDQYLHDNMEKMHICDDSDWKRLKISERIVSEDLEIC